MVRMDPTILFRTAGHSREPLTHLLRIRDDGEHYFSDFLGSGSPVAWKSHRGVPAYRVFAAHESRVGNRKPKRHPGRLPRLSSQILLFSELGSRYQEYSTRLGTSISDSEHGIPSIIQNSLEQKTE